MKVRMPDANWEQIPKDHPTIQILFRFVWLSEMLHAARQETKRRYELGSHESSRRRASREGTTESTKLRYPQQIGSEYLGLFECPLD
jgi:hypothetical protein